MAGKRQHHVWQMLQRGFAQREHGAYHVWVYRRGQPPERTTTKKFGRGSQFYGPEGSTADLNITDFENSTQHVAQKARLSADGTELAAEVIGPLISHLEMRTAFLRFELSRGVERMSNELLSAFSSPRRLEAMLRAYIDNHPDKLEGEMEARGLPASMRGIIEELLKQQISREAGWVAGEHALALSSLPSMLLASVIAAHIENLERNFAAAKRSKQHSRLNYRVVRNMHADFILPDTTLAFLTKTGCTPLSQKGDVVEAVIFPLSSAVAIVGSKQPGFTRDPRTLNRALASCSHQAFLAPENKQENLPLSKLIGKNVKLITDRDMKKIFQFGRLLDL